MLTEETLRRAPKSLLHDHLDGGLRPQTIIELAETVGYQGLPARDADALGAWFRDSADSGSLELYLETFSQTLAVMQTVDGLHRVASECVQDLAADGVVYAEVRYAPELHLVNGLSLEDVVEAVNAGFRDGERITAMAGQRIRVTALLTAMRQAAKGTEIARLVVRYRNDGVVGFDIAGAEAGFPPTRHLDAFEYLQRENAHFTIHAGEAFGLPSIWQALQWCGADRRGRSRLDVRRRAHLQWDPFVSNVRRQQAQLRGAVVGHRDVVDDPHPVPEPIRATPLERLPDRRQPERLAGMDGEVRVLPLEVLEGIKVPGGREPGLRARDVETDDPPVSVAHRKLGNLSRPRLVSHGGQQLAYDDGAVVHTGLLLPRLEAGVDRLHDLVQREAGGQVLLRGVAHLGIDDPVVGEVLHTLPRHPPDVLHGL